MYAIIEVGSKQYNVEKDDIIEVNPVRSPAARDATSNGVNKQALVKGDNLIIGKVLLVVQDKKVEIGQPYIKGAKVEAVVLKQALGEKTTAYKYRRRKNFHWQKGHRAQLTELKIKSIDLGLQFTS